MKNFVKLRQNHKKKSANFPVFCSKVKILRNFFFKLRSRETSRPQFLEALVQRSVGDWGITRFITLPRGNGLCCRLYNCFQTALHQIQK